MISISSSDIMEDMKKVGKTVGKAISKSAPAKLIKKKIRNYLILTVAPFVLVLFFIFSIVDFLFMSNPVEVNAAENSEMKNYAISSVAKQNVSNLSLNGKKQLSFIDSNGADTSLALKWSDLYAMVILEDSTTKESFNIGKNNDAVKLRFDLIAKDLAPTFVYKQYNTKVTLTRTVKIRDKEGFVTGTKQITTTVSNTPYYGILTANTMYGTTINVYENTKETRTDASGVWTTTSAVLSSSNLTEVNKRLNSYFKKYLNTSDSDIQDTTDIFMNTSAGMYANEENIDWLFGGDSVGGDSSGGGSSGSFSEIPLYLQYDSRWGKVPYGEHNIARSGCGPTALAMIVSGLNGNLGKYDLNHNKALEPNEAGEFSKQAGYNSSSGQGTSWGLFAAGAKVFGINSKAYVPSQQSEVYKQLKAGNPVIASVHAGHFTTGGHLIVLTGVDASGKVTVNDPNYKPGKPKSWDMSLIANEANQFWVYNNPNQVINGNSLTFAATGYTGAANEGGGLGITANGTHIFGKDLRHKYIAVDRNKIKLGSKVYIKVPEAKRFQTMPDGTRVDMNGIYTAVDTGSSIKGYIIDIYFGTGPGYVKLCTNSWGRQSVQVTMK